jgi:uncharacterized membrane protein YvlD (DUF360 family)
MTYSRRFALLWLVEFAACLLLFLAQTWTGVYENSESAAWGWFSQTTVPYTTIILASILGEATRPMPDRFSFGTTVAVAGLYHLVLFGTIIGGSEAVSGSAAVVWLQKSSLWIAAVQGLAGLIIARFYIAPKDSSSEGAKK